MIIIPLQSADHPGQPLKRTQWLGRLDNHMGIGNQFHGIQMEALPEEGDGKGTDCGNHKADPVSLGMKDADQPPRYNWRYAVGKGGADNPH